MPTKAGTKSTANKKTTKGPSKSGSAKGHTGKTHATALHQGMLYKDMVNIAKSKGIPIYQNGSRLTKSELEKKIKRSK
ncbi:BA71V-K78R (p10) [African swine fever virus]|uniref:BA71V-K78R (P10) n=1 Tax=African swine fever virus TaxID=10497 RepID=A0A0C5BC68_ASF|nr:BA71V-K78R (p10) [African swine fever virus]AJL34063.1 BA71V-K78R (p10) [African swine fever virus]AXB49278.1 pK78R [African swine fever virus]AXB49452.1 pK78R [African swine fever virus]AXB49624.1 pK78R [African swine fever virus]AXB49795.1 pK78R [African swine fever virus]